MSSSSNFGILDLTLKPLVHFELIFVNDERKGPHFIFLVIDTVSATFTEKMVFSPACVPSTSVKIARPRGAGLLLVSLFYLVCVSFKDQWHIVSITIAL